MRAGGPERSGPPAAASLPRMTLNRSLFAVPLLVAPLLVAAPAGAAVLQTGSMTNGTWTLSAERGSAQGVNGVCLTLAATFADGTSPGDGGGTLLRARVRSFGGDAQEVTTANVKRVVGYDARGRRVARSHA